MSNQDNLTLSAIKLYSIFGCILGAFGVFVWQAYKWIRTGDWPSLSIIDLLKKAPNSDIGYWALWPNDWLGLHAALNYLGLAGALMIVAFLCTLIPE